MIKIDGLFISTVKVLFASVLCSGTTGYVHFILDQQFAPGLISSNTHLGNAVLLCISAICGTLLYFFALVLSGFDPLPGFRQWFVQWNIRSSLSIFIFTFNKFLKSHVFKHVWKQTTPIHIVQKQHSPDLSNDHHLIRNASYNFMKKVSLPKW